jgi:hypothetical protein
LLGLFLAAAFGQQQSVVFVLLYIWNYMRLRSGVVTNDPDDSTRAGEMSNEETAADIAALRNELARLAAEVAAKPSQPEPGSCSCSRGRPTVQVAEPLDNVADITEFSGIVHQRTNPVQRSPVAPDTCSLLDLDCETGHISGKQSWTSCREGIR